MLWARHVQVDYLGLDLGINDSVLQALGLPEDPELSIDP